MSRWFRIYDEIINDPKILMLPEATRWIWIAMLCLTSKNDGVLPAIDVIAVSLRIKPAKASEYLDKLVAASLIDQENGKFVPHNWRARQYKSDSSTERVKRFRNGNRNVSETPPETETETDSGGDGARVRATPSISKNAQEIADAMASACGFPDPKNQPIGWYGAAWWVQKHLDVGWPGEVMIEATKIVARKKRDDPIETFKYLEKPLARAVAEHAKPIPTVGASDVQTSQQSSLRLLRPINGGGNAIIQAADRLIDKVRSFDAGADPDHGVCNGTGEASARLLSEG